MGFGENLRALRRDKKMSQNELAEILGYRSFTTIQKWEMNNAKPPELIMGKIAHLFNVSVEELESDNPKLLSKLYGLDWDDEIEDDTPPHKRYEPFMPDSYHITENYMAHTAGHEDEGEMYLSFPTGVKIDVSVDEMEDIIDDAMALIIHRFNKLKKSRKDLGSEED